MTQTFKKGDRVRRKEGTHHNSNNQNFRYGRPGQVYTVYSCDTVRLNIRGSDGGFIFGASPKSFELVEEERGLYIVTFYHEEQEYVSLTPRPTVFYTKEKAEERARELLNADPGCVVAVSKMESVFTACISVKKHDK